MECRKDEWESAGPFYRNFELGLLNAMARSEILPNTLSPTDLGHSKFEPSQCTKFDCLKKTNNSKEKELPLNSTHRRLKSSALNISDSVFPLQNFYWSRYTSIALMIIRDTSLTLPYNEKVQNSIYSGLAKCKLTEYVDSFSMMVVVDVL